MKVINQEPELQDSDQNLIHQFQSWHQEFYLLRPPAVDILNITVYMTEGIDVTCSGKAV